MIKKLDIRNYKLIKKSKICNHNFKTKLKAENKFYEKYYYYVQTHLCLLCSFY